MIVAGIDGSTKSTGVAIMNNGNLEHYALIDLSKETQDSMKRIRHMLISISNILDKYDVDTVYMEKSFNKQNIDTTQKLSNIAGGVMMYCAKKDIEFVHPMPSEWRSAIGLGQGSKVKRDVLKAEAIRAVKKEYGIDANDDVAEAILLARSAFDVPKLNITEDDLWAI